MNCPNCGAVTDSFHQYCSSCGSELNPPQKSNATKELTEMLRKIELDNQPKNLFDSVFKSVKSISKTSGINDVDNEKISLINNYTIPGNKTDIIDFIMMSRSNITTYSDLYEDSTEQKQKETNKAYLSAWKTKYEQAISLGNIHLSNDPDFIKIKRDIDKEKEEEDRKIALEKKKRNIIEIIMVAFVVLCLIIVSITGLKSEKKDNNYLENTSNGKEVSVHVNCIKNLVFSKYDINIEIDGHHLGKLTHGTEQTYTVYLSNGTHKISFSEVSNTSVNGEASFTIEGNSELSYELSCFDDNITVKDLLAEEETEATSDANEEINNTNETTISETTISETTTAKKQANFHSSNDLETAQKGDSGVFAYIKKASDYNLYYIIDFDNNCVYYFTDSENSVYKAKIKSGSLNDMLLVEFTDGNDTWIENLHFSFKNRPEHLKVQDYIGNEYDYYTTDLKTAQRLKNRKTEV